MFWSLLLTGIVVKLCGNPNKAKKDSGSSDELVA
jgi:hypothetical protein